VVSDAWLAAEHLPDYGPRTALLVVDVQNDFADPSGSLFVPDARGVVDHANAQICAARAVRAKIVYSQDWHPPVTSHFAAHGGAWPLHCVRGTWGAAFHPDLVLAGEVVQKGTGGEDGYSAFTVRDPRTGHERPTRLLTVLRCAGVTEVAIVGLATDYCVLETALDALRLGLHTAVLTGGTRPVDLQPGDGDRALERMAAAGAHVR
jgi:nicotinamidase/pyrazinamidase